MWRFPAAAASDGSIAVSRAAPSWVYFPKSKSATPDPAAVAFTVASLTDAVAAAIPTAADSTV